MIAHKKSKSELAKTLGISRSLLYYQHLKPPKDWALKITIENVLHDHPSYGSRRIADELKLNRKRIQRVMRLYGLKPSRRRGRKPRHYRIKRHFPNLLLTTWPSHQNHIWASDFTELKWHGLLVYVCTVLDLWSREIVGVSVSLRKGSQLTLQALYAALNHQVRPMIFHCDNGSDYDAAVFIEVLEMIEAQISRSRPGCPWENGYQESFYGKFKVDFGDPNRFDTLGELVAEVYRAIWSYNHTRIHSALRMPPATYVAKYAMLSEKVA